MISPPLPRDTRAPAAQWTLMSEAALALSDPSLRQRAGLCCVAHPRLRSMRPISAFHFHSPTLLMVLSGRLTLTFQQQVSELDANSGIVLFDAGIFADLVKYPAEDGTPFQSLFITLSPQVISRFRLLYPPDEPLSQAPSPLRFVQQKESVLPAIAAVEQAMINDSLSDTRLELRLFDLLATLAAQGLYFSAPARLNTAERLRQLIQEQPDIRWTAAMAGNRLAVSEATLRRRLAGERITFDALLREVRMQHGMTLIQTTRWTLTQIADACGYLSAARFSARFKTRFGVSPAQIR
ncbi:helix-turn-helix transcriptional regulator [Pseudomonas graminis]